MHRLNDNPERRRQVEHYAKIHKRLTTSTIEQAEDKAARLAKELADKTAALEKTQARLNKALFEVARLRQELAEAEEREEALQIEPSKRPLPEKARARTMAACVYAAAIVFKVAPEHIVGLSRRPEVAMVRQAATVAAQQYGYSLAGIGRALNRDHTTILSGINRALQRAGQDEEYAKKLRMVREMSQSSIMRPRSQI